MMMLQRLSTRISRSLAPSICSTLIYHASSSSQNHFYSKFSLQAHLQPNNHQQRHKQMIPSNFLKWGSLGSCRNSNFATEFAPLRQKPLDSIIDIQRHKQMIPISLGKRSHWRIREGKSFPLVGAKSSSLPVFCHSFVERKWLYNHVRSSVFSKKFKLQKARMPHILFTGLEDYKARGTQAAPYFTVTYYSEFAESKDTVLIRGDIVFTSKLSDSEAQWLLETAQSFYLNDTRYKLVERFNRETHEFEFNDVLQTLEMPIG